MELLLVILVGTLMGAFNFGFFCLGYYVRDKKPVEKDGITVDDNNKDFIEEMMRWRNFNGGN